MTFRNILGLHFFEKELFNPVCICTWQMLLLFSLIFSTALESVLVYTIMLVILAHVNSDTSVFAKRQNLTIKMCILSNIQIMLSY